MSADVEYHAAASPSSAYMWLECGASLAMGAQFPNKSSEYSLEGTAAHALAADCLNLEADAADFLGQTIDAKGKEFIVTPGFAEPVQIYLDLVRSRVTDYKKLGYAVELHVEIEVPIGHITGEDGATGTSDAIIVAQRALDYDAVVEVIDLKFGQGVIVDAEDNPQGKMYALGAIKWLNDTSVGEVRITISQPRIHPYPSEWETDAITLGKWGKDVAEPRAEIALNNLREERTDFALDEFGPGEKACKFCRAKAVCPALKTYTEETMRAQFDDIEVDNFDKLKDSVKALTSEDLGTVFNRIDLVQDYLKAVADRVAELALNGEKIPGVKVVKGRKGNRAWDDADTVEALMKQMRLKHDIIYDYKLASPTTIEKKLAKDMPRNWKRIASRITQAEGKLQAAPEWDKRPAVEVTPLVEQFDDVSDNSFTDLE